MLIIVVVSETKTLQRVVCGLILFNGLEEKYRTNTHNIKSTNRLLYIKLQIEEI